MRKWPLAVLLGLVVIVMRVPSLIEPPQLADEGIYSDVGWALDHGATLYQTVWDHQPPGVYWLAAAIDTLHTSVFAFHLVLLALVVLGIVLIWLLARRLASEPVAWAAAFAFAVVASLPTLQGDVLNTEVIGSCLVLGAMLAITSTPHVLRSMGAGALLGLAIVFKPAFVADAVALAAIPAWLTIAHGQRAGRRELMAAVWMGAGGAVVIAVTAALLALSGSLQGLLNVLFNQDLTYLGATTSGGIVVSHPPGYTTIVTVLTATRTLVVLGAGLIVTAVLARRRQASAAIVVWWLAFDAAAAMFSAKGFAHYAQQAEPVVCIAIAMLVVAAVPRWRNVLVVSVLATVGAWVACEAIILAPSGEETVILRQPFPSYWTAVVSPKSLFHYLGGGWERLLGRITEPQYVAGFGSNTVTVDTTVALIDSHSRSTDRVFVWGEVPWVYSLSARLPAGEYVSLNSSYYADRGAQARLIAELEAQPPTVFVATGPIPVQAQQLLAQNDYREIPAADGERCWVRDPGQ